MKLIEAQRLEREKKKQEMQEIDHEKFIEYQQTQMEEAKLNEYLNRKSLSNYFCFKKSVRFTNMHLNFRCL